MTKFSRHSNDARYSATVSDACKYCYASFMKRFTNHPEPGGTFLDVKYWPKIKNPQKYKGQRMVIGSVTDGYNPYEEKYGRTRDLLTLLLGSGVEILICTKSDLVLRDLDILKELGQVTVSWSVNTLDEGFRADMDEAVCIERRLAAMKKVYDAGVRTVCFVSPIFPGITDIQEIFGRVREQCGLVWLENINLRGGFKSVIMDYIAEKQSELMPLYEEIYQHGSREYWRSLEAQAAQMAKEKGCPYLVNDLPYGRSEPGRLAVVNYFYHEEIRKNNGK